MSAIAMKRALSASVMATGFAAVVSQIVCMRELLVVFYGNEISTAFMLASWLAGGAAGSALSCRLSDRMREPAAALACCQAVLIVLLPCAIVAIRSVKHAIGMNPGQIVPISAMAASSMAILAPICAVFGCIFALSCRIFSDLSGSAAKAGANIGIAYVLEAAGAVAGGLAASFVLIRLFGAIGIMAGLGAALGLSALALAVIFLRGRPKAAYAAGIAAIMAIEAIFIASGGLRRIDTYSLNKQWSGYELVESKNSIYGNVALARYAAQLSFFDNGLHIYSIPQTQASEEAVHFAMLQHPGPKRVLIIGGGVAGLVAEALRYPVDRIDYVELDPLIIGMAKERLPGRDYGPLEDPRVRLHFEDGRAYVKRSGPVYDVVIVALGDPYTAQLNRFYTKEFFGEAARAMREGGVLSFGLGSSESYLGRELRGFLGSIYVTLAASFARVEVIPGETAYFVASGLKGPLTCDYGEMARRISARGLDLKYVRDYYLASRLSPGNVSMVRKALSGENRSRINRDLHPISYYYDMVYWSSRFRDSAVTAALSSLTPANTLCAVAIAAIAMFAFGAPSVARASALAVAVNGFSQMTFQVTILIAFQAI